MYPKSIHSVVVAPVRFDVESSAQDLLIKNWDMNEPELAWINLESQIQQRLVEAVRLISLEFVENRNQIIKYRIPIKSRHVFSCLATQPESYVVKKKKL